MPRLNLRSDWAFLVTLMCASAIGAVYVSEAFVNWNLLDMTAYEAAAARIREGEVLYGGDVHLNSAYRYAPWFAYAWVPLSELPQPILHIGWSLALVIGGTVAVAPLLQRTRAHFVLLVIFAPLMLGSASGGNVQTLMIGVLVWGLPTRWGWLAVGFAASLKLIPLAFCAIFIAQRRWGQALAAVLLTTVLWMPLLWMPVEPITFKTGLPRILPEPYWLIVPATAGGITLAIAARRSRWTPLAAGIAAVVALPRLFVYELSILLPAVPRRRDSR